MIDVDLALPSLIDAFLVLGPLVVVPLARPLLVPDTLPSARTVLAAALAFAAAFTVPHRGAVALLVVPWLVVSTYAFVRAAFAALGARHLRAAAIAAAAAYAYLVVSAAFALASRAGWTLPNIAEPIVELTGVHFVYAGFTTLTLGCRIGREPVVPRLVRNTIVGLGLLGPALVASGFTWRIGWCQIAGAVVMTLFAWTVAGSTLRYVARSASGSARVLFAVSTASVIAPMALAVFWATAQYFSVPALSIPSMARVHGSLNAIGFIGCGLMGWRAYDARQPELPTAVRTGTQS